MNGKVSILACLAAAGIVSQAAVADEASPSTTLLVRAQEQPNTEIVGRVLDGSEETVVVRPELPELRVERTVTKQVGDRKVTVNQVTPPDLPLSPQPIALELTQEEIDAKLAAIDWDAQRAEHARGQFGFVSATVIDHEVSRIEWWVDGVHFEGWSNVDFNHLSGFAEFKVGDVRYSMILAASNTTAEAVRRRAVQSEDDGWDVPTLPGDGPAFVLTAGDTKMAEGPGFMKALHDLYAAKATELSAAFQSREQARRDREELLRTNPPRPKDAVINIWPGKDSRHATR